MHECEECGKGMVCNKVILETHMKQHGISLEDYYEKHKQEIFPPTLNILDEHLLQTLNPLPESNAWANRCIFKCVLCVPNDPKCEFKMQYQFNKHIESAHSDIMTA